MLLQNGESSQPLVSGNVIEVQDDGNSNDVMKDDDDKLIEPELESSDDDCLEAFGQASAEIENGDVSDLLIG